MSLEEFQLPIVYQKKKELLDEKVISDLELKETENNISIYEHIFSPKTIFGRDILSKWAEYYTYDESFLKETKEVIQNLDYNLTNDICFNEINNIYKEIDENKYFNQEYSYLDIDFLNLNDLNYNELFLQFLSLYNICSPIISLLTPIILAIIPFFIIKLQGYPITLENYLTFLKKSFASHALGSLFEDFNSIKIEKKIYIGISLFFYVYQIYQNVNSCITYFKNLSIIHNNIFKLRQYLEFSINYMNKFHERFNKLSCYKEFNQNLKSHIDFLLDFKNNIDKISPYTFSIDKIKELGHLLKYYYNLKNNKQYLASLKFSFYFNGYLENLSEIKYNITNKIMNFSNITKNKCNFKNAYYPPLKNENPVKNSYKLNKHIIITGPNASGKTTILKTTAINIILNQQIMAGFYSQADLKLYHFIHSYINIPDTSGRDSLFQAEARRCKEIIDKVSDNPKNKHHFCIFDELYSGTNPYEAISSAYSLLEYLNTFKNLNFVLTTHYTDLCKKLEKFDSMKLLKMKILNNKQLNTFDYTYKIENGISEIKGGSKVLNELNYPKAIVSSISKTISQIEL